MTLSNAFNKKLLAVGMIILSLFSLSYLVPTRWQSKDGNYKSLPLLNNRYDLVKVIVNEDFKTGAEIGVQKGEFTAFLLSAWRQCTEFHAIDLWRQQKSYKDSANIDNVEQENLYQLTRTRLQNFEKIIVYHRNYSNLVVKEIKDNSLDFIYVDARHDYVAVTEDLTLYWPKLKDGGIMAGHDYLDVAQVKALSPQQDWSVDHLGNKRTDDKAVKSAVNEFAAKYQRPVLVTLQESWPTWYFRK
jgi:hypothetical protein